MNHGLRAVQVSSETRPLKFRKAKGKVHLIRTVMSCSRRVWTHTKEPCRIVPTARVGERVYIEAFCYVERSGIDEFTNEPVDCFHCLRAMDRFGITEDDLGEIMEQTAESIIAGIKEKGRKMARGAHA